MEIIDKIRKEIDAKLDALAKVEHLAGSNEEYSWNRGRWSALVSLKDFLDSLEAEASYDTQKYAPTPSVDIGDVARVQFASHAKVFDKKRKAVFDWEQFKDVAGIFYGFGKKDSLEAEEKEQYPSSTEMIAEWENNELPMLREKDFRGDAERMAYNAFIDGFAKGLGYRK